MLPGAALEAGSNCDDGAGGLSQALLRDAVYCDEMRSAGEVHAKLTTTTDDGASSYRSLSDICGL